MTEAQIGRPVRVAVLYDSEVVRIGLERMLESYADQVQLVRPDRAAADQPIDVVLCDSTSGVAVAQRRALHGRVWDSQAAVVYSQAARPDRSEAVACLGVSGWVSMALSAGELVAALRNAAAGSTPTIRAVRLHTDQEEWPGRSAGLSPREAEIVSYIAHGLSNLEVAELSFLSVNTVKTYIRAAYRKMGVTRRTEAVLWAIDHGFRDASVE